MCLYGQLSVIYAILNVVATLLALNLTIHLKNIINQFFIYIYQGLCHFTFKYLNFPNLLSFILPCICYLKIYALLLTCGISTLY